MTDLRPLRLLLLAAVGCPAGTTLDCATPETLVYANGEPTGFVRCADGAINRTEALPVPPPAELPRCNGDEMHRDCDRDEDCADGPNGLCAHFDQEAATVCGCTYHCTDDADCARGEACIAGEVSGAGGNAACWPASCDAAADCPSAECGLSLTFTGCGYSGGLDCRDALPDTCRVDDDCVGPGGHAECGLEGAAFACIRHDCSPGRPLLIAARARVAAAVARADWSEPPSPAATVEAELAAHWRSIAALEHASIASFARFTLQLLALGAPAELVLGAQEAAADEVRHAQFAYGLASAYGGAAVGPGPLVLHDAMPPLDAAGVLAALIDEACVGETLGAAEAFAAAEGCADPAIRAGLLNLAEDEARHAALAWRTLTWLLAVHPELRDFARARLAAMLTRPEPPASFAPDHARHGVPSPAARAAVHRHALSTVVSPVLHALF